MRSATAISYSGAISYQLSAISVLLLVPLEVSAQTPARAAAPAITNIQYTLTFDSATARRRSLKVTMRFEVAGTASVLLSLPAWTPGAYEISNYARRLSGFAATSGGR